MTLNEIILLGSIVFLAALAILSLISVKKKDIKLIEEEKYFDNITNTYTYLGFIWMLNKAKVKNSVVAMDISFGDGSNKSGFSEEVEVFARKVSKAAREELGPCVIGHYGINNFLFAIPSIDSSNVLSKMENLKNKILDTNLTFIKLSLVYGICGEDGTPTKQVEKANFALKFAKRKNTNAVYYDERVFKMQNNFNRILNNPNLIGDEFAVYYQPILNSANGELVGAEAKIRWIGENGQILYYPREFIDEFTGNGFITQIDLFAFETVCSLLESLNKRKIKPLTISVNVASIDLLNPFFIENVQRITSKYDFDNKLVHLLISDLTSFEDQRSIDKSLKALKELGIVTEANDFGNESIDELLTNPTFTIYKLDEIFTRNQLRTANDQAIIKGMIDMIEKVKKTVVVNKVETSTVADFVKKCGKHVLVQGNYLFQPLPVNNFETLLQDNRFMLDKMFSGGSSISVEEVNEEPVKPEPIKVEEPVKPEPIKVEEPVKPEPIKVEDVKPAVVEVKPLVVEEVAGGNDVAAPVQAPSTNDDDDEEEIDDDDELDENADDNDIEEEKLAQLMMLYKKEFQDKWEQEMLRKYPELMKKHYARRKFSERVMNLSPDNKKYYNMIKNKIMSYSEMTNATTNYFDTFINKRKVIFKIAIVGKSIKIYLALNPNNYPTGQFPHKDASSIKRHEKTPFVMKLSSNLAIRRANILIDDLAKINQIPVKPDYKEKDYVKSMAASLNKKK